MNEWKETTLGEVIELKRGYDLPQRARVLGTVPIISSSGISDFHDKAMAKAPGVITGRYGTIGQVYYIEQDYWPLNTALYVRDFKGNDPKFISYFLKTVDFQAYSDKAAVPGLNRNHLHGAHVRVPPLPEQHAIAAVLGSLADKIDLNRRMNETLEAMARALFKDWFVDFGPVRAKMEGRQPPGLSADIAALFPAALDAEGKPEGWEMLPLDKVADFLNGLALQKFPGTADDDLSVIKIAEMRAGVAGEGAQASKNIPSQYIVEDGDILFSWSGSLIQRIWTGGKGALNQHLFKVTSTRFPKWLHYYWVEHHLPNFQAIAASKATTMGHIQRHHLTEAKTVVGSATLMAAANDVFAPLFEQIIANSLEARTLAELRDLLLPKLLSGKIRIKAAAKLIEALQ